MTLWNHHGARPSVDGTAWVHPSAQLIGEVGIGPQASVWPGVVLRADTGAIVIAEGSCVEDICMVHPFATRPTLIGGDCVIGHAVHLEGVTIEDAVLIGSGSVLLEGARVRTGAMVAAGAVLPPGFEVPAGSRAQGVPARLVPMKLSADDVRNAARSYRARAAGYPSEFWIDTSAGVVA
jgi:carbonic anhydrase/acetyltransferase-like protein (isoleucine patch superfamily)